MLWTSKSGQLDEIGELIVQDVYEKVRPCVRVLGRVCHVSQPNPNPLPLPSVLVSGVGQAIKCVTGELAAEYNAEDSDGEDGEGFPGLEGMDGSEGESDGEGDA